MQVLKFQFRFILAAAGLLVASCSSLPDDPGLYAVNDSGDIQRLSGGPKWDRKTWEDRSDLPPNLRFFIVQPNIGADTGALDAKVTLRKAGWVRSDIDANGAIGPSGGTNWVAADIQSLNVPLSFDVLAKRDDIIAAVPQGGQLQEGLYVLELKDGSINVDARFGVNWTGLNKTAYAAENCIDRYNVNGAAVYRSCIDQQRLMASHGLQLHIVEPERRTIDGRPVIVVKGIVLNESDRPRSIPMLEGQLLDASGRSLYDWRFQATTNELAPGKSVSFGTVVESASENVANVVVRFADTSANYGTSQ